MIIAMALAAGHVCQQTAALAVGDAPYTHMHTQLAFSQWKDRQLIEFSVFCMAV